MKFEQHFANSVIMDLVFRVWFPWQVDTLVKTLKTVCFPRKPERYLQYWKLPKAGILWKRILRDFVQVCV